ncbi:hypothetical protein ACIOVF_09190 [Pseudomonas sp. NPDC087612]|uniref:Secreted protein n=1 Tax=Pseudomonas vranovensis TaxID=321661 RepID=A0A423DJI1_9PSED|nr:MULTISPECIES: hypothetical protein [Pseudomonas]QVM97558.1 hypothetical protein JYG36_05065 [Pseudomonas sp. SORT22]ROL71703.1 hypothetical protein BHU25_15395 [Pseudomonas vranovensis]UVL55568.1 hypothetical protein LOY22_22425 [Pseudomonas sp. B21-035]UVM55134.1 hypothetical protein LOY37_22750 [Pseudomonas sp. B21-012]SDQ38963.1 hypothetical protein SAMN05216487_1540 [Pseudomonas sp. UC 17F4]
MSNSMGVASVFVLSSLLLSPLAMAEESPAFVARNAERAAVVQEAIAAHKAEQAKGLEQTASKAQASDASDS